MSIFGNAAGREQILQDGEQNSLVYYNLKTAITWVEKSGKSSSFCWLYVKKF